MLPSSIFRSFVFLSIAVIWAAFLFFGTEITQSRLADSGAANSTVSNSIVSGAPGLNWADQTEPIIPENLNALVGFPLRIYFDNLILAHDIDAYEIAIEGIEGDIHRRYWELIPTADQAHIRTDNNCFK